MVGEKVHAVWYEAADDLPTFIEKRQPQIKGFFSWFVDSATGAAKSVFMLIGAIIIAGIMLAWAQPAARSIRKIFISFTDEVRGPDLHATYHCNYQASRRGHHWYCFLNSNGIWRCRCIIRRTSTAALFTLVALVFAIVQLPVTIIALVAVGLLWAGDSGTIHNVIFTILLIAASLIDNFLKPLILGRGLEVPMPIVLIGAVGGMMSGGILGMFIGAAFLAAGYQVFMKWVDTETQDVVDVVESEELQEEKTEAKESKD